MRYIGSKVLLLEKINKLLQENTDGTENTFLDLFSGTNSVANYFQNKYTIYTNDILYFSYILSKATIENNQIPKFEILENLGINDPFQYLNYKANEYCNTSNSIGYYEESYTPTGGAQYLSVENGKRVDFIRNTIEDWKVNHLITSSEYYYLLSSLILAIPSYSNTTGTYGAYLKHWDKRALKALEIYPSDVINNHKKNIAYNEDANDLIKKIQADIVYIDTPYNSRQYASNYHLLENVATNTKPPLKGKTKIFDWKNLRSDYSMKRNALKAMSHLISNLNCTHMVLSYNSEGIISEEDLVKIIKKHSINGSVKVEKIPYRKYKSKIPSENEELYEILIYARIKEKKASKRINKSPHKQSEILKAPQKYIKSPLNYIGGKYKLLPQIVPLFPDKIDTFVDIFCGGINVGINVKANKYLFNDMNSKIIEMFRFFSESDSDELINNINDRITQYNLSKTNQSGYLKFREEYNRNPNPLDLYTLISFSYNYQIRFNNAMNFNNPFGKNRSSFSSNMENNLRLFVEKLHKIDVTFTDYQFTQFPLQNLTEKDFIYLDPPYLITTGNYNDGNRGFLNWGVKQEKQLYELLRTLTKKNIKWALSNVTTHKGKINNLLLEFIERENCFVHNLKFNYDNSSHNSKATGSTEVLVTNYPTDK